MRTISSLKRCRNQTITAVYQLYKLASQVSASDGTFQQCAPAAGGRHVAHPLDRLPVTFIKLEKHFIFPPR